MATYREIVYLVLEEIKSVSDDSLVTEEHVMFLADKMRAMILKQRYSDISKEIPPSNYQTVCIDLEEVDSIADVPCAGSHYMKSVQRIPNMMTIGSKSITTEDYFTGNFAYVSNERFKYVGYNSFLQNQVYATISPSNYLYMKSSNPQLFYLEKAKVTGIFEDAIKATEMQCDKDCCLCDVLDYTYPLEEGLIPTVVELIAKELLGVVYRPKDNTNNANDDLSDLATFLRHNVKSDLAKQIS